MAIATSTALMIAAAAAVASAGVSAYTAYSSGQAQKQAAEYNAEMQRRAAQDALQSGAMRAAAHRDKVRMLEAQQIAGSAAAGVNPFSGSSLDVIKETAGMGELDALRIVNNAQRQAYGLNAQAELDLFQGANAGRAGSLSAGASLLSGASNAFFGYQAASKTSVTSPAV